MIRPVRPASGRCLEPQDALSYQFTGAVRVLLSDYLDRLSIAHRNIPLQEFEQAIASRQLSALPMGKEVTIQVLSDNGSVTERKFTDHLVKLDEAGEKWFQNKALVIPQIEAVYVGDDLSPATGRAMGTEALWCCGSWRSA